jgi:hypothetical protein
MPAGLATGFHGSFIASFPGTNTSWLLLGPLEGLVFLVIAASVITSVLPTRRKPIPLSGLGLESYWRGSTKPPSSRLVGRFSERYSEAEP